MKLILLLSFVTLFQFISCQGPVFERCWEGQSRTDRDGNVRGNFTETECDLRSEFFACETRIQLSNGILEIDRKCNQRQACLNNERNNDRDCYSEQAVNNNNQICRFCCDFDLCNDFDEIPPQGAGGFGSEPGTGQEEEIVEEFDVGVFEEPDGLVPIVLP